MTLFSRHPSSDTLADFASTSHSSGDAVRTRVAAHLEGCATCREQVQWIRQQTRDLKASPTIELPGSLRERILASRAAGVRTILPVEEQAAAQRTPGRARWISVAATIAIVLGVSIFTGDTNEAEAGATAGDLTFEPALPRSGARVRVTYRPVALLGREEHLVLRARLRTPADESYNGGLATRSVASLRRSRNGSFTAEFTLPADVVFGAFVVEDPKATRVDDNDSRLWELYVAGERGQPSFDALDQRAHDLMGRNWEEGHATVRRLVELYPDEVASWSWLKSFQGWIGLGDADSVKTLHRERFAVFAARWREAKEVPAQTLGLLYWYAPRDDSVARAYWRARLLAEAPGNSFAAQERWLDILEAIRTTHDTAAALASFESLWKDTPRDRQLQVAGTAFDLARAPRDSSAMRRWSERIIDGSRDRVAQERGMAQQLALRPSHRAEGIARIRASLAALDSLPATARPLGDTEEEQRRRVDTSRRRLLASLGRALVADGQHREGLAALADAVGEGWDLSVLRSARTANLAAGDTAAAMVFAARIATDPRTEKSASAPDAALAARTIGAASWQEALQEAERAFADRMLANAPVKLMRGSARLTDLTGAPFDLVSMSQGTVTVVAIWSRGCGPAVDALPRLGEVVERLAAAGVRIVGVVEERANSPELSAFLAEKKVTMPTYLDAFGEVTRAFNSWGTPAYYVLDERGRIRFDGTSDPDELLARAEAVRLEAKAN